MSSSYINRILCCLMIVFMLAGCTASEPMTSEVSASSSNEEETASSEEWGFDPSTIEGDSACITVNLNHVCVSNAKGDVLYWSKNQHGDRVFPPTGSMTVYKYLPWWIDAWIWVPYSEAFTVQTRISAFDYQSTFSAAFNKDSFFVSDMSVTGIFEGTVTLRDDNSMQLNGTHSKLSFSLTTHEGEDRNYGVDSYKYLYILTCDAGVNTKIHLEGDELIAEGLEGEYTVTKYEYIGENLDTQEIYTKVYNADS